MTDVDTTDTAETTPVTVADVTRLNNLTAYALGDKLNRIKKAIADLNTGYDHTSLEQALVTNRRLYDLGLSIGLVDFDIRLNGGVPT